MITTAVICGKASPGDQLNVVASKPPWLHFGKDQLNNKYAILCGFAIGTLYGLWHPHGHVLESLSFVTFI